MIAHLEVASRFAIAMLLDGLWQAPLFALAAWLVLRVRRNANATTRHSVFAAALLASLTLPVVTAAVTLAHATATPFVANDRSRLPRALPYRPDKKTARVPTRSDDVGKRPATTLSVPAVSRIRIELPAGVALGLVGMWIVGATLVVFRLIASLLHLERLKRDALPFPVGYRARLARWATAAKGSRNVRLCTSDEIEVPIAVGLFDAMILVPSRFLDELEPQDVDSIVLHELAHIRRSDDWINAAARFGHAFLFFNPAIGWIVGQLDLEREVACDDWVLQQNDALPYATCLAKVVESTVWPYRAMTAPGAFVTRRGMSVRIERLLAKHRDVGITTSFGPAGFAVAVLAALGIVAAFVSPSIAYSVVPEAPRVPAVPAVAAVAGPPAAHATAPAAPKIPNVPKIPNLAKLTKPVAAIVGVSKLHAAPIPQPAATARVTAVPHASVRALPQLAKASVPAPAALPTEPSIPRERIVAEATTPDYIDELAGVGYGDLSVDDLIQLKSIGVSADFIRRLERQGVKHPSVSELVKLRALGIDPAYVGAMRRRFGASIDVDDIAGLRAVGVTAEYAEGMASAGLKSFDPDELSGLRALNITPSYVRDLARAGYSNLTIDELSQLKALGIDADTVRRAQARGFHHLTIEQLSSLRATGVL